MTFSTVPTPKWPSNDPRWNEVIPEATYRMLAPTTQKKLKQDATWKDLKTHREYFQKANKGSKGKKKKAEKETAAAINRLRQHKIEAEQLGKALATQAEEAQRQLEEAREEGRRTAQGGDVWAEGYNAGHAAGRAAAAALKYADEMEGEEEEELEVDMKAAAEEAWKGYTNTKPAAAGKGGK